MDAATGSISPRRIAMGAYCTLNIRRHPASFGEIMEVRSLSPYDDAALFGDRKEIACIPHKGCLLEIVAVGETTHREVNRLLPGQVIRYRPSFFFGDRFKLPSGKKVGLSQLVGFRLQLVPPQAVPVPDEDAIVDWATHRKCERIEADADTTATARR
jgi:hypothetical protein